jgi:hypothetical protein
MASTGVVQQSSAAAYAIRSDGCKRTSAQSRNLVAASRIPVMPQLTADLEALCPHVHHSSLVWISCRSPWAKNEETARFEPRRSLLTAATRLQGSRRPRPAPSPCTFVRPHLPIAPSRHQRPGNGITRGGRGCECMSRTRKHMYCKPQLPLAFRRPIISL